MFNVPNIEDSVPLDPNFPSVSERYFTHYYYIPKKQFVRPKASQTCLDALEEETNANTLEVPCKKLRLDNSVTLLKPETDVGQADGCEQLKAPSNGNELQNYTVDGKETLVMVHSNRLCIVSLSPYHPIVQGSHIVKKVEFEVDGVDRLSNKVQGKGKRGAQVMGSKATLCRLLTNTGDSFDVLCGARGKLVQVNERLLSEPDLCRTSQGKDGWLAIVLPNLTVYEGLLSALTPAPRYEQLWRQQHAASLPSSTIDAAQESIQIEACQT